MSAVSDLFDPANRPECGSWNGYNYHLRHGEGVCGPCQDAQRDYSQHDFVRGGTPRKPRPERTAVVAQMKALDAHRAARAALREQTRADL